MPRVHLYKSKKNGPMFGLELAKCLTARSITRADLSRILIRRATPLSKSYVGMLVNNKRPATPDNLERICAALQLSEFEQLRLHRAAALDAGFKIGGM